MNEIIRIAGAQFLSAGQTTAGGQGRDGWPVPLVLLAAFGGRSEAKSFRSKLRATEKAQNELGYVATSAALSLQCLAKMQILLCTSSLQSQSSCVFDQHRFGGSRWIAGVSQRFRSEPDRRTACRHASAAI